MLRENINTKMRSEEMKDYIGLIIFFTGLIGLIVAVVESNDAHTKAATKCRQVFSQFEQPIELNACLDSIGSITE